MKILITLLASHFLVDFVLQTNKDVKRKNKFLIFTKHIFLISILSYLFLGLFENYIIVLFILITHTVIDIVKLKFRNENIWIFIADQIAHIAVLLFIAININIFLNDGDEFFWEKFFGNNYYLILLLLSSLIVITKFSGILISFVLKPLQSKIFNSERSDYINLPQTGKIIGYLERFIILISVLMDISALIGFLITAKSILRYAEIKSEDDKLFVEYILIGTLLSFSLGITFSYLTQELLNFLKVIL
ncbi:MAG: DUF3307 domain-containing protein [Ignavibacterium sp.]|nr:DUF3307 domain-containing protein [Ignavibacterium sp.]